MLWIGKKLETFNEVLNFVQLFSLRDTNINSRGLAADLSHIEQDVDVSIQVFKVDLSG